MLISQHALSGKKTTRKNVTPLDCCDGCPHEGCHAVPKDSSQGSSGAAVGSVSPPALCIAAKSASIWAKGTTLHAQVPAPASTRLPPHDASSWAMTPTQGTCSFPSEKLLPDAQTR